MYKCLECGHLFEEGEQAVWEERHGLSTPPYEKFEGCPLCHGAYEKIKPCAVCGAYKDGQTVCDECVAEYAADKSWIIEKIMEDIKNEK